MDRLCGPTFYELGSYDFVWSEGEVIRTLSDSECELIATAFTQFPLYCKVKFNCEEVKSLHIEGEGKVIGYVFRPAMDLFSFSSIYLLVFSESGLVRCRQSDATILR